VRCPVRHNGFREIGTVELRVGQLCEQQARAFEVDTGQISAGQIGPAQVGVAQIGAFEVGPGETGPSRWAAASSAQPQYSSAEIGA
jgi:hypothetical protein